jgi:hypothetical protein
MGIVNERTDMQEFIKAITSKPVTAKRMFFRLPNGKIGITAAYVAKDVLADVRREAEAQGATYIKTEIVKG